MHSKQFNSPWVLYGVAIIATALLFLRIYYVEGLFNPDGVVYLQAAGAYLEGGLRAALAVKGQAEWPFYSILIAYVSKVCHVPLMIAAYEINLFFTLGSVLLFLVLLGTLGANRRVQWCGLLVILLWHSYTTYWHDVLRGHGYWCFLLLSCIMMAHYFQTLRWRFSIGWLVTLGFAFLFRLEAAAVFVVAPLSIFFIKEYSWHKRLWGYIKLITLPVLLALLLGLGVMIFHALQQMRFEYMAYYLTHYLDVFAARFGDRLDVIRVHVLPKHDFAVVALVAASVTVFFCYILQILGALNLIVLAWMGLARKQLSGFRAHAAFWGYLTATFLIALLFFTNHFFVSKRYLIGFGLFVLCWVAFGVEAVIRDWRASRRHSCKAVWWFYVMVFAMLFMLVGTVIHFGHDKAYLKTAGMWIKTHTPEDATLFTNRQRIMFYASDAPTFTRGKMEDRRRLSAPDYLLQENAWQCYDYLAIEVKPKRLVHAIEVLQDKGYLSPLLQSYSSHGDEAVLIYRVTVPVSEKPDCHSATR